MRMPLVAGNWKLNGSRNSVVELSSAVARSAVDIPADSVEILICPTFLHLHDALECVSSIGGNRVQVGAQNCSDKAKGAFTGEVAAEMLADIGVSHVVVGHSERRELFGDSNGTVATRFERVQKAGLTPILCVGETLDQRQSDTTLEVINAQINAIIDLCGVAALGNAVVAYEPVWAIGTGETATPQQAQEVHAWIRGMISGRDTNVGRSLRILYGGSVNAGNASELFAESDIDGGLIGGASLKAEDFMAICNAAASQ